MFHAYLAGGAMEASHIIGLRLNTDAISNRSLEPSEDSATESVPASSQQLEEMSSPTTVSLEFDAATKRFDILDASRFFNMDTTESWSPNLLDMVLQQQVTSFEAWVEHVVQGAPTNRVSVSDSRHLTLHFANASIICSAAWLEIPVLELVESNNLPVTLHLSNFEVQRGDMPMPKSMPQPRSTRGTSLPSIEEEYDESDVNPADSISQVGLRVRNVPNTAGSTVSV